MQNLGLGSQSSQFCSVSENDKFNLTSFLASKSAYSTNARIARSSGLCVQCACKVSGISNQKFGEWFHAISKHRERGAVEFFLTNFKVFGNRMKHYLECLMQTINNSSSLNVMIIRSNFQTLFTVVRELIKLNEFETFYIVPE